MELTIYLKNYGHKSIILCRRWQTKASQRKRKERRQSGYLKITEDGREAESKGNECDCPMVSTFFGTTLLGDWNED